VVAQVDGLTDGLEGDADIGQTRDRERAGHRAGGHDQDVVADRGHVACGKLGGDLTRCVVDAGDSAGEVVTLPQHLAQRHHDVPRLDGSGRGFGQERLVRHV
jgi:hypothetical protein